MKDSKPTTGQEMYMDARPKFFGSPTLWAYEPPTGYHRQPSFRLPERMGGSMGGVHAKRPLTHKQAQRQKAKRKQGRR